jgi:hypothetical protein
MTIPGLGGQVPPRPDQQYLTGQQGVPIAPGGQPVLRVTEIIVTPGSVLEGIFAYSSSPPAAGTLVESSDVVTAGTDASGNHYLAGDSTYGANFATSLNAGFVGFYTGSLSAGWTLVAQVETDAGGDLILSANGTIVMTSAKFSVDSSGNVTMGPDLNLTPPMGQPGQYPVSTLTVTTPGGANAAWYADVASQLNALINMTNQIFAEMAGRGMFS